MIDLFERADCHTHILPGMDDGAPDERISEKMLQSLSAQGVHTVVLTPHFYSYKETVADFLLRREAAFNLLKPYGLNQGVTLITASETYLTDYIFNNEDISALCINSGRFLLTELPFSTSFSDNTFKRIYKLIDLYNVVPVVAHIERYAPLLKDEGILNTLIDMGCLAQMNLSSLFNGYFQKKKLLRYIENNLIQVVGTDCHNLTNRPPLYAQGMDIIEKKLGSEYAKLLHDNARQIMQGK